MLRSNSFSLRVNKVKHVVHPAQYHKSTVSVPRESSPSGLFQCAVCALCKIDKTGSMPGSGGHWCKNHWMHCLSHGSQRRVKIQASSELCCNLSSLSAWIVSLVWVSFNNDLGVVQLSKQEPYSLFTEEVHPFVSKHGQQAWYSSFDSTKQDGYHNTDSQSILYTAFISLVLLVSQLSELLQCLRSEQLKDLFQTEWHSNIPGVKVE